MSISYQTQDIDEQVARLKLIFPNHTTEIRIVIAKLYDNRVEYQYKAVARWPFHLMGTHGEPKSQVKPAVDSLLRQLGITGVEEYIMINHQRFSSMQIEHWLHSGLHFGGAA